MALGTALPADVVVAVDDDIKVRDAIRTLMSSVGLECETFASTADARERMRHDDVHCIIIDVRTLTLSGFDAQQVCREHWFDAPLIFVTADADVPMAVRVLKAGAHDVLPKPFDAQALIDSVQRAVEHHRLACQERHAVDDLRRRFDKLTERERAVMALVVSGRQNKQTAAELGTSEKTVKKHRAQVMAKMRATSLPDLVRMSDRLGSGRVAILPT